MTKHSDSETVRRKVREGYGKIAVSGGSCCSAKPTYCGSDTAASEQLAQHIGYSAEELAALPEGANMGLSCGNPTALASLKPGEVVLDLGAGGGFDVFIAGRKVGPTGRVIGVDMTPEMLAVDSMVDWQDPLYQKIIEQLPVGAKPSDYITSLDVKAKKP